MVKQIHPGRWGLDGPVHFRWFSWCYKGKPALSQAASTGDSDELGFAQCSSSSCALGALCSCNVWVGSVWPARSPTGASPSCWRDHSRVWSVLLILCVCSSAGLVAGGELSTTASLVRASGRPRAWGRLQEQVASPGTGRNL